MKCALYVRVSTAEQTVENQLLQLRQFALSQGWQIVGEFTDEMSGSKSEKDRPGFRRMFEAASKRQFDVLLFWSLDRLSREGVLPTLQHLNRLSSYGIKWRSYSEQYIDSCGIFADAVVSIMATIARQENIRRSERTRAGLERARRAGKVLGRRQVEYDAAQVRQCRAEGMSWERIAYKCGVSRETLRKSLAISDPK